MRERLQAEIVCRASDDVVVEEEEGRMRHMKWAARIFWFVRDV